MNKLLVLHLMIAQKFILSVIMPQMGEQCTHFGLVLVHTETQ